MGGYLIWEARNLGMPKWKIWRMMGNLGVDTALGAIPLVGDAFDLLFRSNSRNLKIIKRHLDKHHPRSEEHTSELQSLMRISYAVFCLKKKKTHTITKTNHNTHININNK